MIVILLSRSWSQGHFWAVSVLVLVFILLTSLHAVSDGLLSVNNATVVISVCGTWHWLTADTRRHVWRP